MNDLKSILIKHNFSFKKQFGQNFISDTNLLKSIVDLAEVGKDDTVVEIGCGAGTLTREIAKKVKQVFAFEIDTKLQPVLAETLAGFDNIEVIFRDFLKQKLDEFEKNMPQYTVIANLPYYITTPLVMQLVEHSKKAKSLVIMVQEEVANRFSAKENTADYGAITANIALRGVAKTVKRVNRNMFYPVPNVDSAIVKIDFVDGRIKVKNEKTYKDVVRSAFINRRKTFKNNLMTSFNFTREQAEDLLTKCEIDLNARGETLSPEKFAQLADIILDNN